MTENRLRKHRIRLAALLAVVAVMSFAGFSSAANQTIQASGLSWSPSVATLTTADTLTITNGDATPHSVSWDGGPTTPNCTGVPGAPGQGNWSGTCTFTQAGSYSFFCTVHGQSMSADVTVNSSGPGAPTATTNAATSLNDTTATLNGSVNPNGLATEYFFKYGTTTSYGQTTGKTAVGSGMSAVTASTGVTGLSAATTYHFKLVAENTSGTTEGGSLTFTTPGPPLATTSPATPIGNVNATLRGSVNPRGHPTTYFFKYGETASYGQTTSVASAGSGSSSTPVSAPLTGLSPETTYHFLLVANNSSGEATGSDQTFTTTSTPVDTTDPQTTINSKPADPTNSSTVEFTYASNEPGSTFECKMDGESFTACASTGKTYTGLGEGPHTFQVRATDPSLNTDESPASHSFSVVLAAPPAVVPPKVEPPPAVVSPSASAPETTITLTPKAKTKDRTPTFKFKSSLAGATYECKLDGKALKPCRSPLTTKPLSYARHTLKVAAIVGGLKDSSPAAASFKVVKPR
jgi:plastocyanin